MARLWRRLFRAGLRRALPSTGWRHRSAQPTVGTQYVSMSNDGRYGSFAELCGTNETRLHYSSADPISAGLVTLP